MSINAQFQWQCHPKAEELLLNILKKSVKANSFISDLEKSLLKVTNTRLFDWIDHLSLGFTSELEEEFINAGFEFEIAGSNYTVLRHKGAQLPRVVLRDKVSSKQAIAIQVDSIADFLMTRGFSRKIEGSPYSGYRRCLINEEEATSFWVVERRGAGSMDPEYTPTIDVLNYVQAKELWKTRPRSLFNDDESMNFALTLANQLIQILGKNIAAWVVLECEREFWQAKNTAAQIQKNRQDRLGMGWANHDHHTFRSSRKHFPQLVRLFEMLGFHCRERFYAGDEAGWGAQVMEHSDCRLVLFLDVDLLPHEINVDFRHQTLPELPKLNTVGLWCALHGDSILHSGMHHLEAQFMFDELTQDMKELGIEMMTPFSSFPFLKQAFTKGEQWNVNVQKIEQLEKQNLISKKQAEKFRSQGAVGSHLENLQRREGYKGFNQRNVSSIIQKTDPRNINY